MTSKRTLFISWTPHSRPRDLAPRLGADYVVPASFVKSWWWPARYGIQSIASVGAILRRRPAVVLFTNPPFLAGLACLVGARLVDAECWADCHSGAYNDPRWTRFASANGAVIRRCHGVVFHNKSLAAEQNDMTRHSVVLSIYAMTDRAAVADAIERPRPLVVAACSYAFDEPVELILATAERLPQIDFALTGNAPAVLRQKAPGNVQFTGWLSEPAYHDVIVGASAVICLTTREATMQNGIIEALEHRRPVITSNTRTLRDWAQAVPGVLTVEHDPEALTVAIRTIVDNRHSWLRRAEQGQRVAIRRAQAELRQLRDAIATDIS